MRGAFVDDWEEHGRWLGFEVVDRNGIQVAQIRSSAGASNRAHALADALNAGGIAREKALRGIEGNGRTEPEKAVVRWENTGRAWVVLHHRKGAYVEVFRKEQVGYASPEAHDAAAAHAEALDRGGVARERARRGAGT